MGACIYNTTVSTYPYHVMKQSTYRSTNIKPAHPVEQRGLVRECRHIRSRRSRRYIRVQRYSCSRRSVFVDELIGLELIVGTSLPTDQLFERAQQAPLQDTLRGIGHLFGILCVLGALFVG